MNEYCKATSVAVIPWSSNASDALYRPLDKLFHTTGSKSFMLSLLGVANLEPHEKEIVNRFEELVKKYNVSMTSFSIAWVISRGYNPTVGFSKPERIDDAVDGLKSKLTDEESEYLNEPYKFKEYK